MKTVNQLSEVEIKAGIRALMQGYLSKGYQPEALHTYTNGEGEPLYWRSRLRGNDGKKIFPVSFNGEVFELKEPSHDGKKPLYGLARIKDVDTLYLVEGEYKADWLNKIGIATVATTGASSHESLDFTPLSGKTVYLWSDNDEAGRKHIEAVRAILNDLGCSTHLIDIEVLGLPPKGDAYDWLKINHPAVFEKGAAAEVFQAARDAVLALECIIEVKAENLTKPIIQSESKPPIKVNLIQGSSVKMRPVTWLIDQWLPMGKLTVLAGAGGTGKTTLALGIASAITSGGLFPNGQRYLSRSNVLIWSSEDDPEDILTPRLAAMGADLSKVYILAGAQEADKTRTFNPATDLDGLKVALSQVGGVALILLDPIIGLVKPRFSIRTFHGE